MREYITCGSNANRAEATVTKRFSNSNESLKILESQSDSGQLSDSN